MSYDMSLTATSGKDTFKFQSNIQGIEIHKFSSIPFILWCLFYYKFWQFLIPNNLSDGNFESNKRMGEIIRFSTGMSLYLAAWSTSGLRVMEHLILQLYRTGTGDSSSLPLSPLIAGQAGSPRSSWISQCRSSSASRQPAGAPTPCVPRIKDPAFSSVSICCIFFVVY
jgi:hypothetical protein